VIARRAKGIDLHIGAWIVVSVGVLILFLALKG
jgi:hypothetical protein